MSKPLIDAPKGSPKSLSGLLPFLRFNHRHSGIRYVSPAQRHAGQDRPILAQRHTVYLQARERNPSRWSRHTRNWEPIEAVALNPERDEMVSKKWLRKSEQVR